MRIFRHTAGIPDDAKGASVAIGNFDGVHRGHQAVIATAKEKAEELGTSLAVLTFEPHPRRYFRPEEPQFQLTPLRSKVRRIATLGVDTLQLIHFDEEVSKASAERFIDRVIVGGLAARHVTVGYDFVFGHGRRGNVDLLRTMAEKAGFGLTVIEPVKEEDGTVYSSTNVRDFLREGEPARAAALLGRCWEIEGRVLRGDQRGRQLGYPTANLALDDYLQPALGVYAVWAGIEVRGETRWHMGCANIGMRPTFGGVGVTIETYIFDFTDDIYDQLMRVALVDFIRPERKFDGIAQIREQIAKDTLVARATLDKISSGDLLAPPD